MFSAKNYHFILVIINLKMRDEAISCKLVLASYTDSMGSNIISKLGYARMPCVSIGIEEITIQTHSKTILEGSHFMSLRLTCT